MKTTRETGSKSGRTWSAVFCRYFLGSKSKEVGNFLVLSLAKKTSGVVNFRERLRANLMSLSEKSFLIFRDLISGRPAASPQKKLEVRSIFCLVDYRARVG